MSMPWKETTTCPKCGKENEFTLWQSLNADLSPEAKQDLLDGTLFQVTCKHCGYVSNVNYNILYHDMTHQVMMHCVRECDVEETKQMIKQAEEDGMKMPGYRKRIVTDQNSLREKAMIFDQGLDDRVIEIAKLYYLAFAKEKCPDANATEIYFLAENGKYRFVFLGDTPLHAEFPMSMYEKIKNQYESRLIAAGEEETEIGIEWALRIFKG